MQAKSKATLHLLPVPLGESSLDKIIPMYNLEQLKDIRFFVVEQVKTARRFLRTMGFTANFDTEVTFFEISKKTPFNELMEMLKPLKNGHDVGLMSEAGCPAVADPGQLLVSLCQENNIHVKPYVGPNSILLALMGSGLNGQQFTFHGYLPREKPELASKLKQIEKGAELGVTQIFIETPYRNNAIIETCLKSLKGDTKLCIANNLTEEKESIKTKSITYWKANVPKHLHKEPCIFLVG